MCLQAARDWVQMLNGAIVKVIETSKTALPSIASPARLETKPGDVGR